MNHDDRELFASSFAADAELDFRPAAARWGAELPLMTGRDAIVDTTHQVTNPASRWTATPRGRRPWSRPSTC